jgi:Mrp family chromosome partitioning ATPase
MNRVKRVMGQGRGPDGPGTGEETSMAGPSSRPATEPPPLRLRRSADSEAAWQALAALKLRPARLRRKRIVTLEQQDSAHMAYDMLRTRILHRFRSEGMRSLAITSPAPSCGKTLTCLNLAFSFARQPNCRTLLLDLDLRRPRLAATLGVRPPICVSELLAGREPAEHVLQRAGETLALGLAAGPVRHSTELLQDERTADALAAMVAAFAPDVILYDLPPLLASDDAAAFLSQVDGALLVAAAGETPLEDIDVCAKQIGALTEDLGVVLNKSAFMPRRYYGYGYS